LAGNIYRFGEGFEQRLDHVVRLLPIEQFQVQIGPRFAGEALEKLPRQAEPERAGHVLLPFGFADPLESEFIQAAPDQVRPSAEVYDAPGQTFVHGDVGFGAQWISRVEASAVAADTFLIPQRPGEGLTQSEAAILHRVMGVHFQVALAAEVKIYDRMFGEQGQHVIEKGDASVDGGLALAVNLEADFDSRFSGDAAEDRAPGFHPAHLIRRPVQDKAQTKAALSRIIPLGRR